MGLLHALGTPHPVITPSPGGRGNRAVSSVTKGRGSAKRPLKDLVYVGVRQRLQSLRPLGGNTPPLALRTHPTIPANLLHVVVQLDAMPIRIESVRYVVRAE